MLLQGRTGRTLVVTMWAVKGTLLLPVGVHSFVMLLELILPFALIITVRALNKLFVSEFVQVQLSPLYKCHVTLGAFEVCVRPQVFSPVPDP